MADEKNPVISAVRATKSEQYANIELLLRNWQRLKDSVENTLDRQERLASRHIDLLMDNPMMDKSMYVESLTRQRQYTQIIYEHTKNALKLWLSRERERNNPHSRLRRRLINGIYLEEPRKKLKDYVDEKHPIALLSKELSKAKQELATLVFGANGLLKIKAGAAYVISSELLKEVLSSPAQRTGNSRQSCNGDFGEGVSG